MTNSFLRTLVARGVAIHAIGTARSAATMRRSPLAVKVGSVVAPAAPAGAGHQIREMLHESTPDLGLGLDDRRRFVDLRRVHGQPLEERFELVVGARISFR
ncbi:MAG: hypothetical protein KDC48_01170 [Planctomycetes bacterium]|nr:hypothetical protein [Planctomycetota bacterium]